MTAATTPAAPANADPDRKVIATLTARAALAGHELVRLADGSFLVSRWGLSRPLPDLAAVERWLVQVGAKA